MLVLLGTLGSVQALFLPGYIAARALGTRGAVRVATTSMALSLLLNLGVVSALVALGAYRRDVLLPLFALECVLAVWVTRRANRVVRLDAGAGSASAGSAAQESGSAAPRFSLPELAAWAAVVALSAWIASRVVRAGAGIFTGWDDVASWNRWAMDWFRGGFPEHTWHYPQVVPVAWSLTYAFMGTDLVQSFARGMMPLFALAGVLVVADLARGGSRLTYLAAAWFAGTFLARVNNVTAGLADVPVAFFAALALAECVREPRGEAAPVAAGRPWHIAALRPALFAAGAALTKQAGVYLALLVPALAARRRPAGQRLRAAVAGYALIALVVAPWYAIKQAEIASGRETSEVGHVLTGAHGGLAPLERAAAGFARLADIAGGPATLATLFVLGLLGLRDRLVRPILLAVAIPFTVMWAFGFSYDPRNLSVALVAWAFGCGSGIAWLLERSRWPGFSTPRLVAATPSRAWGWALAILAGGVLAAAVARIPDAKLLGHQLRLQRGLGDPEVAGALADLRDAGRLTGKIISDERVLLAYAPGWDSLFVITAFGDSARFQRDAARPDVRWMLVPRDAPGRGYRPPQGTGQAGAWSNRGVRGAYTLWQRDADASPPTAPRMLR